MSLRADYSDSYLEKTIHWGTSLTKISGDLPVPELVPTPISKGYRSRAKYKIFGDPHSFRIMATDPVRGEVHYENALWMMPSWGKKLIIKIIDTITERLSDFWVDGFEIQLAHGSKNAHLTLSVKRKDRSSYAELGEFMLGKISALEGISIPSKNQEFGKSYLLHNINGRIFYSQYSAFFQSNLRLTSILVKEIERKCQNLEFSRILDLYCGVGLFCLSMSKKDTPSIGVDINKRAIDSARKNAKAMGFGKATFLCSPIENFLQNADIDSEDLVIIDPPRSGCPESAIGIVSKHRPKNIFSISCHPGTHIRDLKQWIRNGYTVRSSIALDMFPFTEYLETVVLLQRKSENEL
jgi:tRNA/tmRNA/rRNA uracil-C5-methylase (TrmA/RlmC/RlmD family)